MGGSVTVTARERRHLHVVPPLSAVDEDPESPEPQDPEPPGEELRVLLW
ncbi:hypothetical protein MycrhDRAFT_3183 [Mycolicibacterium rhodesiae JS60]|nr:hypothetical protein MycrhDRAFT_3183 [Mycolicibacterium rhodesiae JS60]